ncbi:MAG: N-acetylglucosamine kinase, partial [Sphingobacterium sp.]
SLACSNVKSVFFYGSGCQGEKINTMESVLKQVFPRANNINIEFDLLGAARALLGKNAGFAAILGTGTNTCVYDGSKITEHIDSLGFLLGDVGSGAAIGKKILCDYLRNKMPFAVQELFRQKYKQSNEELLDQAYETNQPNRYCASFTRFLDLQGVRKPYGEELVKEAFDLFFRNLVSMYPNYNQYEFNCIGSIGHTFKDILADTAKKYQMKVGKIIPSIIISLAAYHEY